MVKLPWLKLDKKTDPELPEEPPIWLGNHSNGEYFHFATPHERKLRRFILEKANENARRVGISRRELLASAMGMATSLWCINAVTACGGNVEGDGGGGQGGAGGGGGGPGSSGGRHPGPGGIERNGGAGGGRVGDAGPAGSGGSRGSDRPEICGRYEISEEAMFDEARACAELRGDELIFDVQTHHFDPEAEWVQTNRAYMTFINDCGDPRGREWCLSAERFMELLFCESDTTLAALSTWPAALCTEARPRGCGLPLPNEAVAESRELINMAANSQRIVNHVQVMPNDPAGLERQLAIMEEMYCVYGAAAWKLYPAWGPDGVGYFLDDDIGLKVIEKGLELGVNIFCVHKGLPIPGFDVEHNYPTEIGRVARRFPEAKFIVYHSAICAGQANFCVSASEGPYAGPGATRGSDTLIDSLLEAGVGPNENVYVDLGSAYSQVRNNPTVAAHFIGKLMRYCGTDNVLWGTDAILGGSPQSLIESFRALTIPEAMQAEYGYPALDAAQKAKIFGLNAAAVYGVDVEATRCQVDRCETAALRRLLDGELGPRRFAFRQPLGPKTWRDYVRLARHHRALGVPG